MTQVYYINRLTGEKEKEAVYFEQAIRFLYGKSLISRTLGRLFLHTIAKWPFFSWLFGLMQRCPRSRKKIKPFIERYQIDTSEFAEPFESYSSFNDFFIRHLKPSVRPMSTAPAIIPADGRYRFYETLGKNDPFRVKGEAFCLETLLHDRETAQLFHAGSCVIGRLCPTDCHRFYFPFDCTPSPTRYIEGKLFSVSPIAIDGNPWIYYRNRRTVTYLQSKEFGKVAFLEIGATNCGSITQTFTPGQFYKKGSEKGYFSFGGSALIMLFEKGRIRFEEDLLRYNKSGLEVRCLIGQSMGYF